VLCACSSLDYYAQSVQGQVGVIVASRPLEEVVADPRTTASVRDKLRLLPSLLQFAVEELALPETKSYHLYADLQREAMVWNVVATPVDSLQPRSWCYPVLGCMAYRGYFDERTAREFAAGLADDGWDAAVEPVPAYSTLGWFSDPLPSTVIGWPVPDIAGLVFHELAHESLYVPGDSSFNEAYATLVEKEGVRLWLERTGGAEQRERHARGEQHRQEFLRLLMRTRNRLGELYATDMDTHELTMRKAETFRLLRTEYAALRQSWSGYSGYDRWMRRPLNNAHLASINTYHALVPAFRQILWQSGGDMAMFHRVCTEIGERPPAQREAALDKLLEVASHPP